MAGQLTVYVDDNFHYMDESERYKLGEFEDLRREFLARAYETLVAFVCCDVAPQMAHRAGAGSRGHNDDVRFLERIDDFSRQTQPFWAVASVEMHLPTARLGFNEIDLMAKAF